MIDRTSKERHGIRCLQFNLWHQSLAERCPKFGRKLYARDRDATVSEAGTIMDEGKFSEFAYDNGIPKTVAILETKHARTSEIRMSTPQMQNTKWEADQLNVPFFVVTYAPKGNVDEWDGKDIRFKPYKEWTFVVFAMNKAAENFFAKHGYKGCDRTPLLSERRFFLFLCAIRGWDTRSDDISNESKNLSQNVDSDVSVPFFYVN